MTTTRYDVRWCTNCDKLPVESRGLCRPCNRWRQAYGTPRPRRLWPQERKIEFCRCGGIAMRGQLCFACSRYEMIHGTTRPRRLWERPTACTNCSQPLQPYTRRHGLCEACSQYQRRHHQPRPAHLWQCDPSLGWCECGRPAVERQTVRVPGGHDFTIGYCPECLEMAA